MRLLQRQPRTLAFTVDIELPDAPTWEHLSVEHPTRAAALAAAAMTAPGAWALLRRNGRPVEEVRLPGRRPPQPGPRHAAHR